MDNLTPKEQRKIEKLAKLVDEGEVAILEYLIELENKLDEEIPSIKDIISRLKGKDGDNYILTDKDKKEIGSIVNSLVDRNELRGTDGVDYVLTNKDKKDIALSIKVPIVEKVIEKTEIIRELPIVTENVVEVALDEKPEALRDKLETLKDDERLDASAIKNLPEATKEIIKMAVGVGSQPVKAGTNISITYDGNGAPVINSTAPDLDQQTLQSVTNFGATTAVKSTFSGGLLAGVGTVSLPSYSFSGFANTGMFIDTNVLSFSQGGSRRMFLSSNVNLDVPLITPGGSASAPALGLGGSGMGLFRAGTNIIGFATNGIEQMRIDASGNAGIGTAPSARLHAVSTTEQLRVGYSAAIYWNAITAVTTGITTFDAVGGTTPSFVFSDRVFLASIGAGATQAGAGAVANEIWKTSGHATLPDNVLMIGV